MKITIKSFYYVNYPYNTLKVDSDMLARCGILPILWNNNGLYCIISGEKVQNVFDLTADKANLPVLDQKQVDVIHWDECTLIDARIALELLS